MRVSGAAVVFALVAMTAIGGALYAVIFVVGGDTEVVASRVALISALLAPTTGVLILMLQQTHLTDRVGQVQADVNGHLERHMGHSDDQIKAMIQEELRGVQAAPAPLEPRPAEPATKEE